MIAPHGGKAGLQHPGLQAAPTRVGGGHPGTGPVAEQHRQAVGGHDDAGQPGLVSTGGIRLRRAFVLIADGVDGDAVHLIEPVEPPRNVRGLLQQGAVRLDFHRIVAHMGAEVQTTKDTLADAPVPGGRQRPHSGRCGPVGFYPVHLRLLHISCHFFVRNG
ncbi:hypothetical protein D3C80_1659310 [compost metagenome]